MCADGAADICGGAGVWRAGGAAAPEDVGLAEALVVERLISGESAVPVEISSDAEGFQVPAVLSIMLRSQLGPELVCLVTLLKSKGGGAFATDLGIRVLC